MSASSVIHVADTSEPYNLFSVSPLCPLCLCGSTRIVPRTPDTREELAGYKTDIAEGEFTEMDRKYLKALYARLKR